jgi:uncharacterized membrane protein
MVMDDRRTIDIKRSGFIKKVSAALLVVLLTQAIAGIVTAVQVTEKVEQNAKEIEKNSTILNKDSRTLIRVEVQLQQVTDDVQEIKKDAKETRRLIRRVLTEVKK